MTVDYGGIARTFDRRYADDDWSGVARAVLDFAGDAAFRVLEVGCGTGHWLGLVASRGARVAGLDASDAMLEKARAKIASADLVAGRAESLPWKTASFDRVICVNAFHHFADHEAFLREAHRVLAPGGRILVVGLDPHTGLDRWCIYDYFEGSEERDRERYPASASIRAWMTGAGFERTSTEIVQMLPARLDARAALEGGRFAKTITSQLALLSDEDYERGIAKMWADVHAAEARGETHVVTADLRLYGTFADRGVA